MYLIRDFKDTDLSSLELIYHDAVMQQGRQGVAAQQMMDNELVQATNAGAKEQIVYLEPVSWYLLDNSGLRVLQDNVDLLIEVFSK